jgi:Domain of unknown function (DUF4345)
MAYPLSTIYLALAALFFLGSGAYATSKPQQFAAALDLTTVRAGGLNEVRAQYGGLFLVLGMACALATFGIMERRFVLGAVALTFGGVIVGRLFGLVLDRGLAGYGPTVRNLFLVDATGCALAVAALVLEA